MTVEEKILEKIRKLLIADSALNAYTEKRVYASHISTIQNPVYPSISLFLLGSKVNFSSRSFVSLSIQIDCWLPFDSYNTTDILAVAERIRTILDRQSLTDTSLSLKVGLCEEESSGPIMLEDDVKLFHYPSIYNLVAS